jgi:hypothetical protein
MHSFFSLIFIFHDRRYLRLTCATHVKPALNQVLLRAALERQAAIAALAAFICFFLFFSISRRLASTDFSVFF